MAQPPAAPPRLASIDAYRGFVMFLMMAEVLHLGAVARKFPDSPLWQTLAFHQSHVEWRGCSLHDLIQPSFSFLVGVALPFSIAARQARGQMPRRMLLHAVGRAVILVLLGVFLRSVGKKQTNWTFEDTLSQIGLGYVPLFLLGFSPTRVQVTALVLILVGYFALFAGYPLPGPDFNFPAVGVPADWPHHPAGFAAHWDKNSNPAWAFDTKFLNLFPREKPFTHNGGGYATLSFIPTLGTMILGLLAGAALKAGKANWPTVGGLTTVGLGLLAAGYLLDLFGVCPSVKRIWTPSWVLFSGGWCFLLLSLFAATTDAIGRPGWSYPLRVIGANSIVAYCGSHLIEGFVNGSFRTHFGADVFKPFGPEYEPLVAGGVVLTVYWLILWWMYRNRVFVRI
jgi:predicted acyltransferase